MKKGFTLVEMLVVIGILAVLVAASLGAYSKITANAEKKRCDSLVRDVAAALTKLNDDNGGLWPSAIGRLGETGGELDERAALPLAPYLGLTKNSDGTSLSGANQFGLVTPWAQDAIKRSGSGASLSTRVPGGGTIQDHRLYCAVDLGDDGIIKSANVGGESVSVRARAIVWCCGKDGKLEAYSKGLKRDDVYSWTKGQATAVE